jgi:hypothetical protein
LIQDPANRFDCRLGAAKLEGVLVQLPPASGVIAKPRIEGGRDRLRSWAEGAAITLDQQLSVSLLLTREDLGHDHGGCGSQGFLNGGASCLADEHMVGTEQQRDVVDPAKDGWWGF